MVDCLALPAPVRCQLLCHVDLVTHVKGVAVTAFEPQNSPVKTVSRRTALKRGAVAGGTLLWLTPTVSSVLLQASAAEAVSAGPGGGPKPTPGPRPTGLPSHGFFLLKDATGLYGYQISALGATAVLGAPGLGNDVAWLLTHGYAGKTIIRSGPRWTALKAGIHVGQVHYPLTAVTVLVLSAWPGTLQGAWTFDGSFQVDADHDKIRNATLTGGKYYFYK